MIQQNELFLLLVLQQKLFSLTNWLHLKIADYCQDWPEQHAYYAVVQTSRGEEGGGLKPSFVSI